VKMRTFNLRLVAVLALAALVLAACTAVGGPQATEMEIVINPADLVTENAQNPGTPIPTNTLRPTSTPAPAEAPVEQPTATVTLDPYNALIQEGVALRSSSDFENALAKFNEAINLDPSNTKGYLQRGITYNAMGRSDEAITDFNFAVNYDPNMAEAYNARGVAFVQKDQYAQALKDFAKAMELKPDYAGAYTNQGIAYLKQQDAPKALESFTKAVELDPDSPESYFNRGQAYLTVAQFTKDLQYIDPCIADLDQAIAMAPDMPDSYFQRANCLTMKNEFQKAFDDYSKAIELNSAAPEYYILRAGLYPDAGTLEAALADLQKVKGLTQDPEMLKAADGLLKDLPVLPTYTPGPSPTPGS